MQRDDPESEVDRRGDLPVRDGGERGRIEDPLQTRELAGHAGETKALPAVQEIETAGTERDEQAAEEIPGAAAAGDSADEDRHAEPDREQPEDEHRAGVEHPHAAAFPVATITLRGACLDATATASAKIAPRPAATRGLWTVRRKAPSRS